METILKDVFTIYMAGIAMVGATILLFMVVQTKTQENAGGLTDIYLASGTYRKSFYSVMCAPSCVSIAEMGDKHRRIHHHVSWNNCAPKILNEKWKKEG